MSTLGEDAWALGASYEKSAGCGCSIGIDAVDISLLGGPDDGSLHEGWSIVLSPCDEHVDRAGDESFLAEVTAASARLMGAGMEAEPLLVSLLDRMTGDL